MDRDGGCRNGWRGIAAFRLKNEPQRHGDLARFAILVGCFKKQIAIGDGEHLDHVRQAFSAQKRLLQQALAISQTDKGLRVLLA